MNENVFKQIPQYNTNDNSDENLPDLPGIYGRFFVHIFKPIEQDDPSLPSPGIEITLRQRDF
jgi:hypothetical protein